MEFRIADTFTDSLAKLTGEDKKQSKPLRLNLQMTRQSGMSFHRLDKRRTRASGL